MDQLNDILFKHYATDWAAMVLMFISLVRLGGQKRDGFIYGLLANICWAAFGVLVVSVANVLANTIFLVLNIRGYYAWKRNDQAPAPNADAPKESGPDRDPHRDQSSG